MKILFMFFVVYFSVPDQSRDARLKKKEIGMNFGNKISAAAQMRTAFSPWACHLKRGFMLAM